MANRMKQEGGDDSANIQVGGNITIGLTYIEVRQIFLDLFKANFYDLSQTAAQKAAERAQEITDDFLKRFYEEIPHLMEKLREPSVQSSLFNAQKEYAKTGDRELETQLINLLIARIDSDERSLKQIVLDEALLVLPKLTDEQVNLLTLVFSASNLNHGGINNIESFKDFLNNKVLKFFPEEIGNYSFFTHLQYCGCYIVRDGIPAYLSLEEELGFRFRGLLTNGFSKAEFQVETNNMTIESLGNLIVPCLRNPQAYQFNSLNDEIFKNEIKALNISAEKEKLLFKLWRNASLLKEQISEIIIKINPKAKNLSLAWIQNRIGLMQLTSVGYAIAIANYNKETGGEINFNNFI
jgi:hypothetical protein